QAAGGRGLRHGRGPARPGLARPGRSPMASPSVEHVLDVSRDYTGRCAAARYAGRSPPPCTSRAAPLTYDASGEARNRHAPATSSGVAIRPAGTVAPTAA